MPSLRTLRFFLAAVFSAVVSFLVWAAVGEAHPIFIQLAPSGLLPVLVAGLLGGFTCGLIAPQRKPMFSAFVGICLSAVPLWLIASNDFPLGLRNPAIWYWPVWLIPTYAVGGFMSRHYWRSEKMS